MKVFKYLIIVVIGLVTCDTAKALLMVPSTNLTVVVNTGAHDEGLFHFDISKLTGVVYENYLSFDLQTSNHTAQKTVNLDLLGSPTTFMITETIPNGTQVQINCQSFNTGISGNPSISNLPNGAIIHGLNQDTTVTCTFGNNTASKTPVLIIPGVLGTEITDANNKVLWPNILRMVNPFNSDSFLDALEFSAELHPVIPNLEAPDIVRNPDGLYNYSESLINDFIDLGYTPGRDLFTFPYDWRYGITGGNNLNLNALKGQIDYIMSTDAGKAAGKVDVIAHSTGGLLLKKYILNNSANHHIGKAVMVGVPNLGSPKAIKVLIEGDSFGVKGLSDPEMKKISKNMPVVYELAPTVEYYTLAGSYYKIVKFSIPIIPDSQRFLDHDEAIQELIDLDLANESAVRASENLHSTDFDNLDLRKFGVDVSNLVGCKSATFSSVIETRPIGGQKSEFDIISHTTGDGTVPLISAQTIPADPSQVFFIPEAKHGSLLTDNGPRQKIVNILTGANLDTDDKVLAHDEVAADPKLCQIKGEEIKIKSPVDISVIDQDGNHSGLIEDGSIENSIPGADFEIWGDHKYMFLPTDEGQQYSISLKGTGNGTFTLQDQKIEGDTIIQTQNFINIPVTTSLSGNLDISDISGAKLNLDNDSDGVIDIQLSPTSVVDGESGADIIPPQTTASISGTAGNENFYRSDVSVNLNAADPGDDASGVLKTEVSLDGSDYADYTGPITVNTEGVHTIKFYSTDRMGNNEGEKSLSFTIDKHAPEINFAFDPGIMDLTFAGTDNISAEGKISIVDSDSSVRATDEAGNTTVIIFKSKNRKKNMSAEIQSIAYNGVPADIGKSSFRFIWNTDKKKGTLKNLEQIGRSKKDFMITATYAGGKTLLVGHDSTGFVFSKADNLTILHFVTDAGDISWSR